MKELGIKNERVVINKNKIHETEVTKNALKKVDIEEILNHITICESKLDHELEISNVRTLMALYQKVIRDQINGRQLSFILLLMMKNLICF